MSWTGDTRKSIIAIDLVRDAYYLYYDDQSFAKQRRSVVNATDSPLSESEEKIVALCDYIIALGEGK